MGADNGTESHTVLYLDRTGKVKDPASKRSISSALTLNLTSAIHWFRRQSTSHNPSFMNVQKGAHCGQSIVPARPVLSGFDLHRGKHNPQIPGEEGETLSSKVIHSGRGGHGTYYSFLGSQEPTRESQPCVSLSSLAPQLQCLKSAAVGTLTPQE